MCEKKSLDNTQAFYKVVSGSKKINEDFLNHCVLIKKKKKKIATKKSLNLKI